MERVTNIHSVEDSNGDVPMESIDIIDIEEDEVDTGGMAFQVEILNHTRQELEKRQLVASLVLLCSIAHALHLLQLLSSSVRSRVNEGYPHREERRRELMSYLVQTERCRDIIRWRMTKGKNQSNESGQGVRELLRWTEEMDYILLTAFTEEMNRGNRIGGNWTPEAYAHVVAALVAGGVGEVTKQHVKNRMKTAKEKFSEAFDLFNSLSGFAWNPITRRFEAEDEVWADFIRDKPQATKWRTMQIRHYDLLKGLFGADRAGGQRAKSGKQILKNYENQTIDLNEGGEDTSMHDQEGTTQEDVQNSAPNVEAFSPASAPSNQSTGTPGSRGTKRKAPMVDLIESQVEKMSVGIGLVAEALNSSNDISDKLHNVAERQVTVAERQVAATERRNDIYLEQLTVLRQSRSRVYTEAEVWELLCELNVMDALRMQCYEFLCTNEQKKRLIFGVPPHMRIQTLFQMMSEAGHK
ncbi:Myb/SANT-like domain [Sesbania bispinosa]|nr:Myb/SANT-like domain [Sesbania bispinosa]